MDPFAMDHHRLQAAALLMQEDITMKITEEERQWALNIKEAVNESEELSPISDFDYVQYAMVTQGNTQEALHRIEGMQAFRQEYGVDNSVEQGVDHLKRVMEMVPGFLLHLDNSPDTKEAILVWDASVCYPELILSPNRERGAEYNWRTYVVAIYYMNYCSQPCLLSIRDGLTLLMDCGKVGWENVSMDFERRMHHELRAFYPLKWKKILAYNTLLVANVGWSLFKQFMNPRMRESLQLGCQIVGTDPQTSLRQLFLQPSPEGAKENILQRARVLLHTRNENAKQFTL